ncbi:dihydropteroate synthase [Methyloceanibacter methanicus]|uniref:dihydropteroate synthase n=1 Tax=Methyloceanibacter methanicus TaxID=1774968 RepID=A0A1E3W3E5_9HYPH|nr:dihydropteroate synthase [Methyloceanibacter methanicus]ODS00329.1 dihydropteroate synthase [Methyloceanibacter methanicus]
MADGKIYLRPLGFVYGPQADAAIEDGLALPLAGGPIAFTGVELIEGAPGKSKAYIFSASALGEAGDPDLRSRLDLVTRPRPPFAGLDLSRPTLMGIVNVTPDSFSDGGLYNETEGAVAHAAELIKDGAAIVDIGGESTRPGSETVASEDELARVLPVLEGLKGTHAAISIDTRKAEVARAAAKAGAKIFNDVSAFTYDPDSLQVAVETGLDVVLMHAQGEPKTMQDNPTYADVVLEVFDYLEARIETCVAAGLPASRIAADPGLGFGKTLEHNLALFANVSLFHGLGVPLLIGASRKQFIRRFGQAAEPRAREPGSHAAAIASASQGAQLFRVHDVAGTSQALGVWRAAMFGSET